MNKLKQAGFSFIGLVITLSTLVLLSAGVLGILGVLFTPSSTKPGRRFLDGAHVEVDHLLVDRL